MNLDINIFITQGIATKIESKGKKLLSTDTYVKEAISVESSGATNGRARSLCLHQSDWINGYRRPDVAKLIGDLLESTIYGATIVFSSCPGAMISDVRQGAADFNFPSKVRRGQQKICWRRSHGLVVISNRLSNSSNERVYRDSKLTDEKDTLSVKTLLDPTNVDDGIQRRFGY